MRNDLNYDIIFNYDATNVNKCADKNGTYTLDLKNGKTSVNDYKYLIVVAQTNYQESEVSNIVYNFPDEGITKYLYYETANANKGFQYCNSLYYNSSYNYCVRYSFDDTSLIIGDISIKGWEGALIKKIVGVY